MKYSHQWSVQNISTARSGQRSGAPAKEAGTLCHHKYAAAQNMDLLLVHDFTLHIGF